MDIQKAKHEVLKLVIDRDDVTSVSIGSYGNKRGILVYVRTEDTIKTLPTEVGGFPLVFRVVKKAAPRGASKTK